ncbi:MAG: hypothetical protein AUI14_02645 [Actinobacteria bacterium 13_2_20CM_2_71_6]|nr:MAG: hypothetical protein AUI14_02645 [Actinobacteria bacterium 13_2_20CM_2_71_6]
MAQHPTNGGPTATSAGPAGYAERLVVPWWLWLLGLALAALAAAEVYLGAPGLATWVPYAILLPLTALGLWRAGRIRVAVREGELWVDDAHLPVRYVAEVGVLDAAGKRAALGPQADPLAFVVQRPWVKGAVLVVLDDPADPTPYWVVSARRPERVARAVLAARAAAR